MVDRLNLLKLAHNSMKLIQVILFESLLCLLGTAGYTKPLKYSVNGKMLTYNHTKIAFVATITRK